MVCVSRFNWLPVFFLLPLLALAQQRPADEAQTVAVIYNAADANSTALAKYYASRRQIPDQNLIGLNTPLTEEISRDEFNQTIAGPLRQALGDKKLWRLQGNKVIDSRLRYAVVMRGVPLKIRSIGEGVQGMADLPPSIAKRDEASVDSELACLGLGNVPTGGLIQNPYFRRFTPIGQAMMDPGLLLVCRLDAASDMTVRAMIDDSISTEREGLWGWGYIDSGWGQGRKGYTEGDDWLTTAATKMRERGMPVLWDKAPEILPMGYPVTDAALYFGWYADKVSGAFLDPLMRFRPGAVAVHIHSFSAATLRDGKSAWCAPLLERGAAATLGNVYEPYLTLTAQLDLFQDRLAAGFSFGESAYASMRVLSWMAVAVGDPLYRPYAAWQNLDGGNDKSVWARYRSIVLAADGNLINASGELTKLATQTGNSMPLEALAAAQADAGRMGQAMDSLNQALALEAKPMPRFRLGQVANPAAQDTKSLARFRLVLEKIGLLRGAGKMDELRTLILQEKGLTAPDSAQGKLLQVIYDRLFPPPPTPTPKPSPAKPAR